MSCITIPATLPADNRFVLPGVAWQTYRSLRCDLERSPIRLTYDGSNLELMSPSRRHEVLSRFLGWMIRTLAVELNIPIGTGGSMTFQRADLERGLEPDDCFWIAGEPAICDKVEIDLDVDPPPDLAIEIDISPSRLNRPGLYAAFRVREIWRYDGQDLHVDVLQGDGTYRSVETSLSFPFLPVSELARFLSHVHDTQETRCMRMFLTWLREQKFETRGD